MDITLKVAETSPKFVGREIALVDPKVIDKEGLATGDVIENSGKKKSYVLLRPSERARRSWEGPYQDRWLHQEQHRSGD
jgi:hypothetical protein